MLHDIEFPDGKIKVYSANIISENMYAQVDADGYVHNIIEEILDYKKDAPALDKQDMYIATKYGQRCIQKTNLGWKLFVQWKNGTKQCTPMKDLKYSNPVEVAEIAS